MRRHMTLFDKWHGLTCSLRHAWSPLTYDTLWHVTCFDTCHALTCDMLGHAGMLWSLFSGVLTRETLWHAQRFRQMTKTYTKLLCVSNRVKTCQRTHRPPPERVIPCHLKNHECSNDFAIPKHLLKLLGCTAALISWFHGKKGFLSARICIYIYNIYMSMAASVDLV